jgi:hypothetical protein
LPSDQETQATAQRMMEKFHLPRQGWLFFCLEKT